jgi:hypothetical protein
VKRVVYLVAPFSQSGPRYYRVKVRHANRHTYGALGKNTTEIEADFPYFTAMRLKQLKRYLKIWEA